MYHIDAGLDSLERDDEVAIGTVLEEGMYGTTFWLKQKPNHLPWHQDPPHQRAETGIHDWLSSEPLHRGPIFFNSWLLWPHLGDFYGPGVATVHVTSTHSQSRDIPT